MAAPGANVANSAEDLSAKNYVAGLTELVMNANLGEVNYNRQLLCRNIERSIDRYRSGGFNLENAVSSGAPILVFTGAYNDLVSGCDGDRLPETLTHLYNEFGTQDVPAFVDKQVDLSRSRGVATPPGQCGWTIQAYRDKFSIPASTGFVCERESWVQARNRETPGHVDFGRVLSYIPPCLKDCFKIWIAFLDFESAKNFSFRFDCGAFNRMAAHHRTVVVVQKPGDVVYTNSLVYHSVVLGYKPHVPAIDQWSIIDGYVFILKNDLLESYIYATRARCGSRKNSEAAWAKVLVAYCAMEGRELDMDSIKQEIESFTRRVFDKFPEFQAKSKRGTCSHRRSRKRKASIAFARTFKK
ncbi:hypothetical protein DVH05_026175 [Phytophthora capsici]|nr:hypothetical protein DVH05_026175 [Phytophthora capsici]